MSAVGDCQILFIVPRAIELGRNIAADGVEIVADHIVGAEPRGIWELCVGDRLLGKVAEEHSAEVFASTHARRAGEEFRAELFPDRLHFIDRRRLPCRAQVDVPARRGRPEGFKFCAGCTRIAVTDLRQPPVRANA